MRDFLLNSNGDIDLSGGDFVTGDSDGQHIQHIMICEPGELKQSPLVGVGITKQVNGLIDGTVRREIKLQLETDGYEVSLLDITGENITIDAQRKS